jgi:hypothetical protein
VNLTQLQAAVYARLGVDNTDGLLTPALINGFINDANHQVELMHDWPWLQATETITTVAGTDSYAPGSFNATLDQNGLPILWHRTDELRDGVDAAVLERQSVTELDDRWLPTMAGKPREWAVYGDKLIFRPVPDAVYTIVHRYVRQEGDLTAGSDTPSMPASTHAAIADLATFIALRRDRNDPRAQSAEAAFQTWMAGLQIDKRRYKTPGRVRVRPGGWI